MRFVVEKGANKTFEFRGLAFQYIYMFAGVIIGEFFLAMMMSIAQVNWIIIFAVIALTGIPSIALVFKMNKKYGRYGLMQEHAGDLLPAKITSNNVII